MICPVLNMVWDSFAKSYKPWQNETTDDGMIAFKGRLSNVKYLPAKPIKRRIKVCMHCDPDIAYLHQFEVYLSWQQNYEFGLGYIMWWWSYVRIYQEKITMSIMTTYLHLSSCWRTCWLVKHSAMGQYKGIRNIFQMVFVNLVEWSMMLTNHTRMAAQTL